MNATADYTSALLDAMPPELMRRLEIIAEQEGKPLDAVIVDFLKRGANTPQFLGTGC